MQTDRGRLSAALPGSKHREKPWEALEGDPLASSPVYNSTAAPSLKLLCFFSVHWGRAQRTFLKRTTHHAWL